MKSFHCPCGHRVFFDSTRCLACETSLVFDPVRLDIVPLDDSRQLCANGRQFEICNWQQVADGTGGLCLACGMNEIIPNLDAPDNLRLWGRLEAAKRRLAYNLLSLRLLSPTGGPETMRFRFMEDHRRNPNVLEEFVGTGHAAGTITINLLEADDIHRTAAREAMMERYRTLLGHFRHEAGHYYFSRLVTADERARFQSLFGDDAQDYRLALEVYYRDGPRPDWIDGFVSAYASAHPLEDWAETFAHYLHIVDALETAHVAGLARIADGGHPGWVAEWMGLAVTLNELVRSLGVEDAYPFIQTQVIIGKLKFIDRLVNRPGGSASREAAGEEAAQRPS